MAGVHLYDCQLDAIHKMHDGCILCGETGSGKSITALGYFYLQNGGDENFLMGGDFVPIDISTDLYIITTARKRDTYEWEKELSRFLLSPIAIDSWNNIKKYTEIKDAFFIFDEQRVVGNGAWVKSFLKITKVNRWILLSATPGDTWEDYIPVFIANGFYHNRTEFCREHIVYCRYTKYPKVDRYLNTQRLNRLRRKILVDIDYQRHTISHHEDLYSSYDVKKYKEVTKTRWNPYRNEPIINAADLCGTWRRVVNSDESRQLLLLELVEKHPRALIFYNFDYELEILRGLNYGKNFEIAEWNGHKHQPIPEGNDWVYLVQYNAGSEGWNCIKTDTIIFYSQNYSYKISHQAAGRIDRANTPYTDLYFYHLKSRAPIDLAISKALNSKKDFNERKFLDGIDI